MPKKLIVMSLISRKIIIELDLSRKLGRPIEIFLENRSQTLYIYGSTGI